MSKSHNSSEEDVEMVDIVDEPSFVAKNENVSMASMSVKSTGRAKLPFKWTRIIKVDALSEQ